MKTPIRIVIAEDYALFREGFRLLFEQSDEIEIVGEAKDGIQLTEMVRSLKPDIVITDIEMPVMNGIDATKMIKNEFPATGVIALTQFCDDHFIVDMLEAGASGYLLKSTLKNDIIEAVKQVNNGGTYYCKNTSLRLTKMIALSKAIKGNPKAEFSEKEIEIIKLICQQFASKEIADMTDLTHRTVEKYRDNIMEKIGARNMVGIVVYAIRHGMFKP